MFWSCTLRKNTSIPEQTWGPNRGRCQGFRLGCCSQPAQTSAQLEIKQYPLIGTDGHPLLARGGKSIPHSELARCQRQGCGGTGMPWFGSLLLDPTTQKAAVSCAWAKADFFYLFYLEDSSPAQCRGELERRQLALLASAERDFDLQQIRELPPACQSLLGVRGRGSPALPFMGLQPCPWLDSARRAQGQQNPSWASRRCLAPQRPPRGPSPGGAPGKVAAGMLASENRSCL